MKPKLLCRACTHFKNSILLFYLPSLIPSYSSIHRLFLPISPCSPIPVTGVFFFFLNSVHNPVSSPPSVHQVFLSVPNRGLFQGHWTVEKRAPMFAYGNLHRRVLVLSFKDKEKSLFHEGFLGLQGF